MELQRDAESTTDKWGLEAGLFKVFTNKDDKGTKTKGQQAKELLTRYGSAYLITSISFAIVSFTLCYALISSGIWRLPHDCSNQLMPAMPKSHASVCPYKKWNTYLQLLAS